MGCKECSRAGCKNIMCDRYSPDYGYLCGDCFQELVQSGAETSISKFMVTLKRPPNSERAAYARYAIEFPAQEAE